VLEMICAQCSVMHGRIWGYVGLFQVPLLIATWQKDVKVKLCSSVGKFVNFVIETLQNLQRMVNFCRAER
jgi:hypothetical protein